MAGSTPHRPRRRVPSRSGGRARRILGIGAVALVAAGAIAAVVYALPDGVGHTAAQGGSGATTPAAQTSSSSASPAVASTDSGTVVQVPALASESGKAESGMTSGATDPEAELASPGDEAENASGAVEVDGELAAHGEGASPAADGVGATGLGIAPGTEDGESGGTAATSYLVTKPATATTTPGKPTAAPSKPTTAAITAPASPPSTSTAAPPKSTAATTAPVKTPPPKSTTPATTPAPSKSTAAQAPAPPSQAAAQTGPNVTIPVSVGNASQVITVVAPSKSATTATLRAWQKNKDGTWTAVTGPVKAYVGSAGIGVASESLSRTPIGTFTLTEAFGALGNPGTSLPYRVTGPNDWWVSDTRASSYNTWQTCAKAACAFKTSVSEHLQSIRPYYDYAVVMDVNRKPVVPGNGSAFFLHVSVGKPTAGCVAIDKATLVTIMKWLDPAQHPRIATGIG